MTGYTLPQRVFAWANHLMDGSHGGFGLVGTSAPWVGGLAPAPPGFVPSARLASAARLPQPLTAVEFRPDDPEGAVLELKKDLGLDASERLGRRVVQVLVDADRRLDALTAANAAAGLLERLDWDMDAEPATGLPAVTVEVDTEPVEVDALASDAVLGAIVQHILDGRRVVVLGISEPAALPAVRAALALVPPAWLDRLSFATYCGTTSQTCTSIAVASPAASVVERDANPDVVHVDVGTLAPRVRAAVDLLRETTPEERAEIRTVDDLDTALRLRQLTTALAAPVLEDITIQTALESWQCLPVADQDRLRQALCDRVRRGAPSGGITFAANNALTSDELGTLCTIAADVAARGMMFGRVPAEACADANAWGTTPTQVADRLLALLEGTPDGPDYRTLAGWLAQLPDPPVGVLVEWSDQPEVCDEVLRSWGPVVTTIARWTWSEPGWAANHPTVAVQAAQRFTDQCAEELDRELGRGLTIAQVQDVLLGSTRDTVLALAAVALRSFTVAAELVEASPDAQQQTAPTPDALPGPATRYAEYRHAERAEVVPTPPTRFPGNTAGPAQMRSLSPRHRPAD